MLLKDKTAIIYGGSGAVGGAVAKAYAREGARVFLAARRRKPLEAVAEQIGQSGGHAEVAPVDATDSAAVAAHLDAIASQAGPVRIMFNAVSLDDTHGQMLIDMPQERFIAPIITAMTTWFVTGTAVARHMAANGGGVIVGISANAGRQAIPVSGGFGVACAAIEHFIRQLAVESGPSGVRAVFVRSPGSLDAPGVLAAIKSHAEARGVTVDAFAAEFAKDVPLRRIASLSQVADAATLLASDLASAMTATMANTTGGAQVD